MSGHYSNAKAFDLSPTGSASNIVRVANYSDGNFLDFLQNLQKYSGGCNLNGVTIALSTYLTLKSPN